MFHFLTVTDMILKSKAVKSHGIVWQHCFLTDPDRADIILQVISNTDPDRADIILQVISNTDPDS